MQPVSKLVHESCAYQREQDGLDNGEDADGGADDRFDQAPVTLRLLSGHLRASSLGWVPASRANAASSWEVHSRIRTRRISWVVDSLPVGVRVR